MVNYLVIISVLSIGEVVLYSIDSIMDLGIVFDDQLRFDKQVFVVTI